MTDIKTDIERSERALNEKADTSDTPQTVDAEYGGLGRSLSRGAWTFRSAGRLTAIVTASLVLVPMQAILCRFPSFWWPVAGLWHRTVSWLMGVRVKRIGTFPDGGPVLYVANHISWLDIIILGGRLPNASFIAKSEIAGWGAAGKLANLHRTIYVRRTRRTDSAKQRDAMLERFKDGHGLIMFPESTSTDGVRMDPFKSALFSVAERGADALGGDLVVQPITISYTEMNGMPLTRALKPRIAWLGDMELVSHFRAFLNHARTTVTLEFHPPVTFSEMGNRKKLAAHTEQVVRDGLERSHIRVYKHGLRDHETNDREKSSGLDS